MLVRMMSEQRWWQLANSDSGIRRPPMGSAPTTTRNRSNPWGRLRNWTCIRRRTPLSPQGIPRFAIPRVRVCSFRGPYEVGA